MILIHTHHPTTSLNPPPLARSQPLLQFLGKSSSTFIRDLSITFYLLLEQLRIKINFFNLQQSSFLTTHTQRMKLQLLVLLRSVNQMLSIEEQFVINMVENNMLEYHFRISWKEYKVKIPKLDSLKRFMNYLFKKLKKFEEIIYFVQPPIINNNNNNNNITNQQSESSHHHLHLFDQPIKYLNTYRTIMLNCRNIRHINKQYFNRLIQLKSLKPSHNQLQQQMNKQQIYQIQMLFYHNVNYLYKQSLGLEEGNQEIYKKCMNNISYHQSGRQYQNGVKQNSNNNKMNNNNNNNMNNNNNSNNNPNNNKDNTHQINNNKPNTQNQNKIVHGIDVVKRDKQKIISKQGAHSQITRGLFMFRIVKTIQYQVAKQQLSKWLIGTQRKSQLTVKRCNNPQNQASKNSFMNQLYFLHYIRDHQNPFIGKYYLQMKPLRERNQCDPIYMKSYYNNVDYIIRKCVTLTLKQRLTLIYRISLGVCFINSKSIIHRDLKPHNVVVNQMFTPHIIDFGSCSPVYGNTNGFGGYDKRLLTTKFIHIYYHQLPYQYHYIYQKMTKEQYQQHILFDIYSLGRLICFVMFNTLQPPHEQQFQQDSYKDMLKNILFLIHMCLNVDPDDRPTIGQVTGFLGVLAKIYGAYQEYFLQNVAGNQNNNQNNKNIKQNNNSNGHNEIETKRNHSQSKIQ